MVKFSKMVDRGKHAETGGGRKPAAGGAGLNLRRSSMRGPAKGRVDRKQAVQEKKSVVENRKLLYAQATEYLSMAFGFVQADKQFSIKSGFKILEKIVDTRTPIDALFLKAIHDEEFYDLRISPSVNVAIYAIKMAENLGFSKNRQIEIGMMGLLHDIGMARISEELVYEQNLTEDEFLIFKERPQYGFDILSKFGTEYAYLAECALQIHERIDGSGYPRGLQGDEIHEYAQIIGLVDIYEALIHSRPQREKILHFYAVKEIIKSGKGKFQQRYLKALLNTFSIFPLGSYVRLNSGAIGRVILTYPDQPMRPRLQIVYDSQSKRVLTERLINLPDHSLLYILDSVSEQELVDISEASYLVTKPGRGARASQEPTGEPDEPAENHAPEKIGAPVDEKPVAEPHKEPTGKPQGTFIRKVLLVAAGLFFAAGVAWQFLADTQGDGKDQVTEKVTVQTPEKEKAVIPDKSATAPEKEKPRVRPPENLPDRVAVAAPERPGAEKSSIRVPEQGRYPYSILIASYRQLQTAQKSFVLYKGQGLEPFWVKVDLGDAGIWFRVFSGHYAESKQAETVITKLGLEGALAKPTRYAVWIGGFSDKQKLDIKIADLSARGFSTYVMPDSAGTHQLYVGAFYTRKGAQDQYARLKSAGVDSRVVER